MEREECIDICYKVLKMLLAAEENHKGLCEQDTSGVNHSELLCHLENYQLVKNSLMAAAPKLLEACRLGRLVITDQYKALNEITKAIAKKAGIKFSTIPLPPLDIIEQAIADAEK